MIAYLFPGQGSQKKKMGADLFDHFAELTARTDEILGYSIKNLCVENPENQLNLTQYTQPALYTVNAFSYLKKVEEDGIIPNYVAGHSLGEYNALFAAGAFDFETGLKLVQKRGQLMARAAGGGMAAVIGFEEERVQGLLREHRLESIDVANFNSPTQIVLSGPKDDILAARKLFEQAGVRMYAPLKVSAAFHSRYMVAAMEEFGRFLEPYGFAEPQMPVISNMEARPYTVAQIKLLLKGQISNSVKWMESVRYLMGKGVETFVEIGPGKVLTKLNKAIFQAAKPLMTEGESGATPDSTAVQAVAGPCIETNGLGSAAFRKAYGIKYAYLAGSMLKGISSEKLVIRLGKAGLLGYFGSAGLEITAVEAAITRIQETLGVDGPFGVNLLGGQNHEAREHQMVELLLKTGIRFIETSGFIQITAALVLLRLKGLRVDAEGRAIGARRILAKASRPEVAEAWMSPAPEQIVQKLLQAGRISEQEAQWGRGLPMCDDLCVEADSGWHTGQAVAYALMPAMIRLREDLTARFNFKKAIQLGACGGIGTPEAAASAFVMGADFILTGSINQCTVEAGTSDLVKEMLQAINVQHTAYVPSEAVFEMGGLSQVLSRGVFFHTRAGKLWEWYRHYGAIEEIGENDRKQIEGKFYKRSLDEIFQEVRAHYLEVNPQELERAERSPKAKMALLFRWYFLRGFQFAQEGRVERKVDFNVPCGPALGAFNQWVEGTDLAPWSNRHVDEIAEKLMRETATILNRRFKSMMEAG